jgi:hypothetical protein
LPGPHHQRLAQSNHASLTKAQQASSRLQHSAPNSNHTRAECSGSHCGRVYRACSCPPLIIRCSPPPHTYPTVMPPHSGARGPLTHSAHVLPHLPHNPAVWCCNAQVP